MMMWMRILIVVRRRLCSRMVEWKYGSMGVWWDWDENV